MVQKSLRLLPFPASDHNYSRDDFAYVYREGIKQYTGPHLIESIAGKSVIQQVGERCRPRWLNIAQLGPASISRHPTFDEKLVAMEIDLPRILHKEKIQKHDARASQFDDAKKKEILSIFERGTFRIVLEEDARPSPNLVPSRFVLTIKNQSTEIL